MSFFKKIFAPMQAYEIEDFVRDGFLPGVKGKVKTMGIDVFAQREGLLALTLESKHHKLLNYLKEQNFQYPASVNNTSIISYAISVGMRAKQVRTLLESGASFEYERGLTPLEAALDVDAEYDMYVLLLEYKIAARSLTRAPMIYQIASASHLKEDFRAELVDALAKKGLIDVNEKDDQAEPITQYLHDAELPLLLKEVIRAGGDLRPIATTYNFEYQSDFGHELSQAIFTKQTRMKDEEKLPFLEKDDFEACLENIAQAGDANGKQLILSLTRNCIIPDMDKVILGEKIMQLGVDVDEVSQDEDASTAFVDYCRYYEFHEYFGFHDFLLDHGADINGKGKSPLVHLLRSGQFNLLKHLIQRGLDIVSLDSEGLGAMNAFRFPDLMGPIARRIEILDFLVANGLDINQQVIAFADEAYPSTGLIELLIYAEDAELLEYVLAHYPQCEIKGVEISSALRRPVFSDDLCLRLIAKKPDYTQSHFYSNTIDDTKYTYSAESIGIAIDLDRFAVAEQLLDQYPQMKAHCEVEPLYYRVYLNTRLCLYVCLSLFSLFVFF